ncbi:MAG: hypothetical protein Sapg2KO_22890 [Saprospiraceae bacterium]
MNSTAIFLLFGSTFGLSLSLFFSLVLFRWKHSSSQLLAFLLLCLSIRIGKSVFYNFVELPLWIKNIGLAANLAVGPLLYFYVKSIINPGLKISKKQLLHFLPAALYLLGSPFIPNATDSPSWSLLYSLIIVQSFCYVGLSFGVKNKRNLVKEKNDWLNLLIVSLAVMWTIYLLIFIGWLKVYLAGAVSFTLLMIIWSYFGIVYKPQLWNTIRRKYEKSPLQEDKRQSIFRHLLQCLDQQYLYLDAELSLNQLAEKLGTNSKLLSQTINESTGSNFVTLINQKRIAHAKKLLISPDRQQDKIISIAFDSGFRSLSTFNAVFKQHTQLTPSAFRKLENTARLKA